MWQAIFPWRVHHVAGAPFFPGHVEYAVGGLSGAHTPPAVDEPGGICLFFMGLCRPDDGHFSWGVPCPWDGVGHRWLSIMTGIRASFMDGVCRCSSFRRSHPVPDEVFRS